jgi:hypothetical protein
VERKFEGDNSVSSEGSEEPEGSSPGTEAGKRLESTGSDKFVEREE